VPELGSSQRVCGYCGSENTRRLGECSVCHRVACEHCGNVQIAAGERRITHRECLKKDDGHFRMIRFVE